MAIFKVTVYFEDEDGEETPQTKEVEVSKDEIEWSKEVNLRQMGEEVNYFGRFEIPGAGEGTILISEYPAGIENISEMKLPDNCEIIEDFDL